MIESLIHGIFSGSTRCLLGLLGLLLLCACAPATTAAPPRVVAGVLDLRGWNLATDGPVRLDGDWELYWDASVRSLGPEPTAAEFVRVPGSWLQAGHSVRGKAVYRARILTEPGQDLYGLKVYEFPQSYRLYVNARQVIENGSYNQTPGLNARSLVRPLAVFADSSGLIDLRFEVVNFDESEPGPRRSMVFGLERDVRGVHEAQVISDMLVCGVLLIMAAYHLGLYAQRRRETGSLLFGLVCLIMILRITVTEEHYLHQVFPGIPGNFERLIDVFSFFVLAPAFSWIFQYFFERDFHPWVLRLVGAVFIVAGAVYAVAPLPAVFEFYLVFTLLTGLYLFFVLLRGVRRGRFGARVFLAGFLIFLATTIWDVLSFNNIVRTIYVSQIGFVCFIFSQAYVLSMRFNQALSVSEKLTENLELLVTERTRALEVSNQQLAHLNITDALTGIFNRRHFDEMLHNEWNRAQRTGRPLALLLLDIDHFKAYNDHYGHQGGDDCLKAVAGLLAAQLHRAGDTVARYGGEEFVVLIAECGGSEALGIAEQLRRAVEDAALPHLVSAASHVSVSVGIASGVPSAFGSAAALLKTADEALYRAKHQGRNRAVLAA